MDCLDLILSNEHDYYRQCTPEYPSSRGVNDVDASHSEYVAWRDGLVIGDWVDVWLRGRWRCGQLVAAVDEQHVEVAFEGPSMHENVWSGRRELLERHSNLLAPLYSKTRPSLQPNQHWRFTLTANSPIDALDTVQKWYTARVLELRGDHIRIAYDGWTNKYDETLSLYSDRLAPYHSKALGGKESNGVQASVLDRAMDDSMDEMWPNELVRWRGRDWSSAHWVENVQYFARLHGFQLLFYRIYTRHLAPLSIASLRRIASAAASCTFLFTRQLAYDYLPTFHFLLLATLLDLSDVELRQLSKELLEELLKCLQRLLSRFCNARHMQAYMDDFSLAMAVKRLRCSVVERRVNGMNWLQDYITSLKRFPSLASLSHVGTSSTWLTPQQMIVYIEQHGVLQTALSLSTSHQRVDEA